MTHDMGRRDFLKNVGLGAVGAVLLVRPVRVISAMVHPCNARHRGNQTRRCIPGATKSTILLSGIRATPPVFFPDTHFT